MSIRHNLISSHLLNQPRIYRILKEDDFRSSVTGGSTSSVGKSHLGLQFFFGLPNSLRMLEGARLVVVKHSHLFSHFVVNTQLDRKQMKKKKKKNIMQQVDRSSNIVDRFMSMTIGTHSYIHTYNGRTMCTVQRSPTWRHFL